MVNDIGSDPAMRHYPGEASAEAVAAEIRATGGKAVASTHSVASPEGAEAIVQTALDAFGGVDILANNAAGHFLRHPFSPGHVLLLLV